MSTEVIVLISIIMYIIIFYAGMTLLIKKINKEK